MLLKALSIFSLSAAVLGHCDHEHQAPISGPHKSLWYNTLPGDGGTQVCNQNTVVDVSKLTFQADSVFSGISTFGRLPYYPCLASDEEKFDIAFLGNGLRALTCASRSDNSLGAPFDTGTSYRPGARFGPSGIRQGSRRLNL